MVIISDIDKLASEITKPVISFVKEAIGKTAWSFLRNNTSRVSWSITSATLDRKSRGSAAVCRPANWPNEGRGGTALATTRLLAFLAIVVFFFLSTLATLTGARFLEGDLAFCACAESGIAINEPKKASVTALASAFAQRRVLRKLNTEVCRVVGILEWLFAQIGHSVLKIKKSRKNNDLRDFIEAKI
jgi:hypothetical protein